MFHENPLLENPKNGLCYHDRPMKMPHLVLATLLVLPCLRAQTPSPPKPPATETGPDVDVLHHLRRATVSLGLHQTIAGKEHFATVGSAVIVAWDDKHGCLLTAKHVFFDPTKSFFPTILYMRLPQSEPRSEDDLGVAVQLVVNGTNLWHGYDDADLATIGLPDLSKYKDLHGISLSDFGGEGDVFQGASVVVFGYPELLGPEFQTTPIARNGIIAWTDPNGRFNHTFLVDANVFNGNSGGPVFHLPTGISRTGGFVMGGAAKLIGIVSKDAVEDAQVRVGQNPVRVTDQQTGVVTPMTAQVLNIGGIGIVEPALRAKKLIIDTFKLPPQ